MSVSRNRTLVVSSWTPKTIHNWSTWRRVCVLNHENRDRLWARKHTYSGWDFHHYMARLDRDAEMLVLKRPLFISQEEAERQLTWMVIIFF
jgi:hypothetical protein